MPPEISGAQPCELGPSWEQTTPCFKEVNSSCRMSYVGVETSFTTHKWEHPNVTCRCRKGLGPDTILQV